MTALPSRTDIAGNPSRATAKTAFGQWWDAVNERLFAGTGSAAEKAASRAALEAGRELQPIAAAVGSNALTLTLNPTSLDFRSATLGSGAISTRKVEASVSLVVPAGATLGTDNGVAARLMLLALDNAGTIELAVVNATGGVNLGGAGLISTTAISAGASSAALVYSQTARTNLPYRVVGFVECSQATAGQWATAASLIQGAGPGILGALATAGYGQSIQTVTGSRALSVTYTNTTDKPILAWVAVRGAINGSCVVQARINGVIVSSEVTTESNGTAYAATPRTIFLFIPPGFNYRLELAGGSSTIDYWVELR